MTTVSIFYPIIITIVALLITGAISKNKEYGTLLIGSMGVLITVLGVILLASPLSFESGSLVDQDTGNTTTQTVYTYTQASTTLNTTFSLTLTIIGIMTTWLAYMQRKDIKGDIQEDGLGGFDD